MHHLTDVSGSALALLAQCQGLFVSAEIDYSISGLHRASNILNNPWKTLNDGQ
jgi:hypothetical protein